MEIDKIVAALNSRLRREILRVISKQPMTVVQVLEELKKMKIEVKYRETVYRALEKLLDAKLVEKFYVKEKGLCYKATTKHVIIDIAESKVEKEPAI